MPLSLQVSWSKVHSSPWLLPKLMQQLRRSVGTLIKLISLVALLLAGRRAHMQAGAVIFTPPTQMRVAAGTDIFPKEGSRTEKLFKLNLWLN